MQKRCERCGEKDMRVLVRHHIKPKSEGGTDENSNIMLLCANCHLIIHHEHRNGKEISKYYKSSFNTIHKLPDGRIEIVFARPTKSMDSLIFLLAYLGHRRGNELITKDDFIVGVRCNQDDWESLVSEYAPNRLDQLQNIIKEVANNAN